jgi:hypothetical protein
VPSCEQHNSSKSDYDQALVTAILRSLDQIDGRLEKFQMSDSLRKTVERNKSNYEHVKRQVSLRKMVEGGPPEMDIHFPYINAEYAGLDWFNQLSAALCWVVLGDYDPECEWSSAETWSNSFFKCGMPMTNEKFVKTLFERGYVYDAIVSSGRWKAGWQTKPRPYPPELYEFRLCVDRRAIGGINRIHFWHKVSTSHSFFTTFTGSSKLLEILRVLPDVDPPPPFLIL